MISKKEILNKINNNEDKNIISNVLDQAELCERKSMITFTDFLDMQKLSIVRKYILQVSNVRYRVYGGYEEAERAIVCFYPDYIDEVLDDEYPISIVKVQSSTNKFQKKNLSHRDYLGSVIGLGINRSKIGDIIVFEEGAYIFVRTSISDYIDISLTQIGRTNVSTTICNKEEISLPEDNFKELSVTVQSIRLDAIISKAYNISRSLSSGYITKGKVFVNWILTENASITLKDGDIITVRGLGRVKIAEIGYVTKKGRTHILLQKYI